MADRQLNCEGLNCPMPIVEITRAVRTLESGQTLEVTATDLAFKLDLEAWSRRTGHAILEFHEGEVLRAVIQIS
ncbi:MAG: sulfurtransferase TusA family protein [Planctomycetaceae bacterium]